MKALSYRLFDLHGKYLAEFGAGDRLVGHRGCVGHLRRFDGWRPVAGARWRERHGVIMPGTKRPGELRRAGAFFVSSGSLFYFYLADVSVPLLGTGFVETPQISGGRSIIHFIFFLLCVYFGFVKKTKEA
jgi:hypothetical protein